MGFGPGSTRIFGLAQRAVERPKIATAVLAGTQNETAAGSEHFNGAGRIGTVARRCPGATIVRGAIHFTITLHRKAYPRAKGQLVEVRVAKSGHFAPRAATVAAADNLASGTGTQALTTVESNFGELKGLIHNGLPASARIGTFVDARGGGVGHRKQLPRIVYRNARNIDGA
jgi:hypothetical protein